MELRRWWIVLAICCSFALASPVAAVEPPPALAWNATLGGSGFDYATAIDQTSDGGYIIAGFTESSQSGDVGLNHGRRDGWVVKVDGVGKHVWNVTLGWGGDDQLYAVQQTSDGGYIVAGTNGGGDYWVVKLDGTGQPVWTTTLGGGETDLAYAVQQTSDGGYVVSGFTNSDQSGDVGLTHGFGDYWVVKLNGAGQKVWNRTFGGAGGDSATAMDQTSDGGYIIAGVTDSRQSGDVGLTHLNGDYWVVKLNGAGEKVWATSLGGDREDLARAVTQTSDGGYIVAGTTVSDQSGDVGLNHGLGDCWVVKLNGAGQHVWNRTLGGSKGDLAWAVDQTSDGGCIVTGSTASNQSGDVGLTHGGNDYWVVKLNEAGETEWNMALGGVGDEEAHAVERTNDGGYVVAGYTSSNQSGDVGLTHGGGDYWVVKLAGDTRIVAMPGGTNSPTDMNADGKYDDVNGNGRPDFADVVLYFNQMSWITANEPMAAFDYNGNGRIDFADVVWLFNNL